MEWNRWSARDVVQTADYSRFDARPLYLLCFVAVIESKARGRTRCVLDAYIVSDIQIHVKRWCFRFLWSQRCFTTTSASDDTWLWALELQSRDRLGNCQNEAVRRMFVEARTSRAEYTIRYAIWVWWWVCRYNEDSVNQLLRLRNNSPV